MDKQIIAGIIVDEETTLSFLEVCRTYHISEEALQEMVEHGLFQQPVREVMHMDFNRQTLSRMLSAQRLQADLGVNIPGAVLVLELLEELETARNELMILRHHVNLEA